MSAKCHKRTSTRPEKRPLSAESGRGHSPPALAPADERFGRILAEADAIATLFIFFQNLKCADGGDVFAVSSTMVRRPNITAMVLTPLGEAVDNEADHGVIGEAAVGLGQI